MIKIENVIKGLECRLECGCIQEDHCNPDCPYLGDPRACSGLDEDIITLLKAQEPIQIIKVGYYDHGRCPKCDRYVSRYSNFCWYCGQRVKWND